MKEKMYKIIKTKTDELRKSKVLKSRFNEFFSEDVELPRFIEFIKKIAMCPLHLGVPKSFPDPNFSRDVVTDETYSFYYMLDKITGGKHNFLQKVQEQEKYTKYSSTTGRSSCNLAVIGEENGKKIIRKEILISEEPLLNNRTVKAHEYWHAISEKDYNMSLKPTRNQFLGEIGSMTIDIIASEYLKTLHPEDKEFCKNLSFLVNEAKLSDMVDKARDGYLDYLLGKIIVGSRKEQEWALNEVVNNINILWSTLTLERKLGQVERFINDPKNNHYDPMYECRYVMATAISRALMQSDSKIGDKVDKLAELNNHLISLDALSKNGEKSSWNIVTSHLGIPKLEVVMNNLISEIMSYHSSQPTEYYVKETESLKDVLKKGDLPIM